MAYIALYNESRTANAVESIAIAGICSCSIATESTSTESISIVSCRRKESISAIVLRVSLKSDSISNRFSA